MWSSLYTTSTTTEAQREDDDYDSDTEYGYQDEYVMPENYGLYHNHVEGYEIAASSSNNDQGHGLEPQPTTISVEPADAILLIAENFHVLRKEVPDAKSGHLWGLAKDCLKMEDSAMEMASYLIQTGDYPVEQVDSEDSPELDEPEYFIALKYSSLKSIFPDADTTWIWDAAKDHADSNDNVFNAFVLHIQETDDYQKINLDGLPAPVKIETKKQQLTRSAQEILNTIDPRYIEEQLNTDTAMGYNEQGVSDVILKCIDNKRCPSKSEDYYRNITEEAILQYSSDTFDIEQFLLRFPEPVPYFEYPVNIPGPKYRADVFKYLRTVAPRFTVEQIRAVQKEHKYLIRCHRLYFGNSVPALTIEYQLTDECARFINELTYIRFYEIILPTAAIYSSLIDTGGSCDVEECCDFSPCELCENQVPLTSLLQCTEAHMFCVECVRRWVDSRLEDGHVSVNCLQYSCQGNIPDKDLKRILTEGAMAKLIKRRQDQDVVQAQVEGIVHCLWCGYSYVPRNEEQNLVCLSPECGERWCKKCRELAHYPNPCEDTPEEVKKRVFIEERMTTAVVKTCPRCQADIVKDGGCDHVLCKCGAGVCFNCGQIAGHHHCDRNRTAIDAQAAGQQAKSEADHLFPGVSLNHDPTRSGW